MEKKIKTPLYIFHLHAVGKGHQSHQKKKKKEKEKKKKERATDFINSELDAVWWGVVL